MFAYCANNPVMYTDITGYSPEWLIDAFRFISGALITVVAAALTLATSPLFLVPGFSSIPLLLLSMTFYGTMLAASPFSRTIKADMNLIAWNPFNRNSGLAASSNKISFYKGTFVIRYGDLDGRNGNGISLGIIFLERDGNSSLLMHEYGHQKQQRLLGFGLYTAVIAIPSIISFHISENMTQHMNRWYEQWATEWGKKGLIWW
jgi:hypothetical protein